MENSSPLPPSDSKDTTEAPVPYFRRSLEQLSNWWREHFEKDDDSNEKSKKKSSRIRNAFRSIFTKEVAVAPVSEKGFLSFGEQPKEKGPETTPIDFAESDTSDGPKPLPEESLKIPRPASETSDLKDIATPPETTSVLPPIAPEHRTPNPETPIETPDKQAANTPEGPPKQPPIPPEILYGPSFASGNTVSAPEIPTHTTIIENHPNAVAPALVGSVIVDQLSRHRDRKIRKEAQVLQKRVHTLEDKQKDNIQEFKNHVQQPTNHNPEQRHQKIPETRQQPYAEHQIQRAQNIPVPRHEQRPVPLYAEKASSLKLHGPEQAPLTKSEVFEAKQNHQPTREQKRTLTVEELIRPHLQEKQSELIMRQVEAAAEHNIPLENRYELSHEVKDVATSRSRAQQFASGLGIKTGKNSSATNSSTNSSPLPGRTNTQPRNQEEAYKNAAQKGFWAAIILLVFIVVLFMLTNR